MVTGVDREDDLLIGGAVMARAREQVAATGGQTGSSVARTVRIVRGAGRIACGALAAEALVLVASLVFLASPMRAPVTLLTIVLLAGLLTTIVLVAVAVGAGIQRLSLPHTRIDDEVEVHVGWRAPVAVGILVTAVVVSALTWPIGTPAMRNGQFGYLDTGAGSPFVAVSEDAYAVLVLQQLRLAATCATVAAAWVAMSLTRHHPGWDRSHHG